MSIHRRIGSIYRKELVDILRDHRTLVAMIVVPIVLYPLLMLGSIQAVTYQSERLVDQPIAIGVVNDLQGQSVLKLIRSDASAIEKRRRDLDPGAVEAKELPTPLDPEKVNVIVLGSEEEVKRRIRDRTIPIGVILDRDILVDSPEVRNHVRVIMDKEYFHAVYAHERLREVIARTADRANAERKAERGLPDTFDEPFEVSVIDLSAPPSILGQVLPLVLVLMTITGAIYPAIDLTAGERERGTLESLMVCPVPVLDLIVGKFLVVTTVAIMGATLNLVSVSATVYFGGFAKVIASNEGGLPVGTMLVILLSLIPFAVLMSAIMIAVCSYARTFKEAQNYVTPVILAVLIPGGLAALPTTRLDGVMLVMPVGNMVLLARDFLLGASVPVWHIAIVLLATSMYAAAAVAVAANIFGQESVVFSDTASLRTTLSRRWLRPRATPTVAMSLLATSLLFPVWFFAQSALSPGPGESAVMMLHQIAWAMPLVFVVIPLVLMAYARIDLTETFRFRWPASRFLIAAILLGAAAWIPTHEINVAQYRLIGIPQAVLESARQMQDALLQLPLVTMLLIVAVIPAFCEELLFRGFLLSGLSAGGRKWTAILSCGVIFAVFHIYAFRFPVTAGMGVVLAYLAWQSRSIVPCIIAHAVHNGLVALRGVRPEWFEVIGLKSSAGGSELDDAAWASLPILLRISGLLACVFAVALMRARKIRTPSEPLTVSAAGPVSSGS